MSTKIYYAWRAPADRIVDVIDWGRDTMMEAARIHIEHLKSIVGAEKLGPVPDHIKGDPDGERIWESAKRLELVWKVVEEEGKSPYRGAFDVSCGLNIWVHGGHVYVIPIAQPFIMSGMHASLPEWMENFCYWNNTDQDDRVSEEEWAARGDTWESICTGDGRAEHNARRLYHEVIDVNTSMGSFDIKMACGEKEMLDWSAGRRTTNRRKKIKKDAAGGPSRASGSAVSKT